MTRYPVAEGYELTDLSMVERWRWRGLLRTPEDADLEVGFLLAWGHWEVRWPTPEDRRQDIEEAMIAAVFPALDAMVLRVQL